MSTRAIGIDLNPQWIGLTVVEISAGVDTDSVNNARVLDHRLIRLDVPIAASAEAQAAHMAATANVAIALARKWHTAAIVHEDGLGKLRWSKKSRSGRDLQTINHWSRNALLGGLARRCALAGIRILPIWGGYSTTIGNMSFDLPDACASAAEIARRGIAATRGHKDRLPAVPRTVHSRRWKDGIVPEDVATAISKAERWQDVHRAMKAANLDVRRPHPPLHAADPGPLVHHGRGYAVRVEMGRRSGRIATARPALVQPA